MKIIIIIKIANIYWVLLCIRFFSWCLIFNHLIPHNRSIIIIPPLQRKQLSHRTINNILITTWILSGNLASDLSYVDGYSVALVVREMCIKVITK